MGPGEIARVHRRLAGHLVDIVEAVPLERDLVGGRVHGYGWELVPARNAPVDVGGVRREREREGDNTLHACRIDLRETG